MERYKNLGGDSGVVAYEIGADSIKVGFSDGSLYLYTYGSAGQYNELPLPQGAGFQSEQSELFVTLMLTLHTMW
jgi:hypothetical protein